MTSDSSEASPVSSAGAPAAASFEPLRLPADERASSVVDLIHRAVEEHGPKEALRWKLPRTRHQAEDGVAETDHQAVWRSTTYDETWRWIRDVALSLRQLGIRRGDHVCIISRTRPAWLVADLASLSLGAVSCPIYPSSEANQAAFIINNVGAKLIFVENAQQAAKIESIRAECPTIETIVAFDDREKLGNRVVSFDDMFEHAAESRPEEEAEWDREWRSLSRDDVATIIHTSGTTANPKGAILTHGNLVFNYEAVTQVVDFTPDDLFLSWLPLSHIYERVAGMVVPLGRGCAIAYAEPIVERLPANMAEVRPTVMVAVPRLYERVYARVLATVESGPPIRQRIFHWAAGLGAKKYANHLAGRGNSPWLSLQLKIADRLVYEKVRARTGGRVRYFVSGSAPLAGEIGEFFYGLGMLVLEGYGLTETSPFVSINRPETFKFGTVGQPAPDTEVKIDPGTGEIMVRGPQIMRGYLNAPEDTAMAIEPDGWFHTGDIGELDEIGRISITDRLKNIIVLGNGKNVSPAPMEAALYTSPLISQAVILGDRQNYTGAIVAPDFEELERWAAANGMAEMPPEQLVQQKAVQRLYEGEIKRTLARFGAHERPRRTALLPRLLSEEEGELTPSLKTKKRVVIEKWPDKVAYLFDEKGGDTGA